MSVSTTPRFGGSGSVGPRSVRAVATLSTALFLAGCASACPTACGGAKESTQQSSSATGRKGVECLTTPNGIPRKVIVKKENVLAYENYDFTGESHPLK